MWPKKRKFGVLSGNAQVLPTVSKSPYSYDANLAYNPQKIEGKAMGLKRFKAQETSDVLPDYKDLETKKPKYSFKKLGKYLPK